MRYLRKVICPELNISAILEDQAFALRLFTKLYDNGYYKTVLSDYFVDENEQVDLSDPIFKEIMDKIK